MGNGSVYTYDDPLYDYGLIARITPPHRDTATKWLICARLGPTGTEAAATYLSANARILAKAAGTRDFVKVVKCGKGNPDAFAPDDGETFYLKGGTSRARAR